ncbi:MAG: hypothetical protein WAK91_09600 [Candidatus Acidiferrales bacterium]|jgi:hypothetical protein
MTTTILMQYMGFEAKNQGREYLFQVRCTAEDMREFTLTIADEAFNSHRVRYQDAPSVCSLRLRRELVENSSYPSNTNFPITDAEMDDYRVAHTSKTPKSPYSPKPRNEF